MQNDLIMNHVPLPKYFDGIQWNTVIKPTRKSIPQYLHQDLPELRHMYIKQIFKQMGKFNVPNLQFFNGMIKNETKKVDKKPSSVRGSLSKDKKLSYNEVKQELQYALLLTDRGSNVMDQLVEKAQKVQMKKPQSKRYDQQNIDNNKTFRSRSVNKSRVSEQNDRRKYFDNTVDLVFRNRRNKYIQNLRRPKEEEVEQIFQKRFDELGLIDLDKSII